jgi:predicted metal-dependent hydrolase
MTTASIILTVGEGDRATTVTVTARRARRLTLRVHPPDARVTLSVPLRTSQREARALVAANLDWIHAQRERILREAAALPPSPPPPAVRDGATWWLFGEPVRLTLVTGGTRTSVRHEAPDRIVLRRPEGTAASVERAALERWQRRVLRGAAWPYVAAWSEELGVAVSHLGIRRMRTRWGTCAVDTARVWLNLELITRPLAALEYVVVHELVHLRDATHGPGFVALMDAHLADWRDREALLARPPAG